MAERLLINVEHVDEGLVGEQMQVRERFVVELLGGNLRDDASFVERGFGLPHFGEPDRGVTTALGVAL